ncbi:hypothetical protein K1T71_003929 [Dendrolimus kikuchii]|uniref:Uncharacterized protein n=1 Tax=Dendrolimus kikuchii TaxID=765133 RepID=A0ACC1D9I7_9NEOP|nr:hypothetical protein K1T71_003929 [Dendrolimus kikuchii]
MSLINFVISENGVTKHTLSKCIEGNFVTSLEDFRVAANETLTKMIEESYDSSDIKNYDIEDDESDDDDEDVIQKPKKKRK